MISFQDRGNDILGLNTEKGDDGLPYTTLSYANGMGYYHTYNENGSRIDLSIYNYSNPFHRYPASIPLLSETHGGEDVGIYASGPESHLFIGNYEQSYIPILMAHAAQIGPFARGEGECYASTSKMNLPNISLLFFLISSLLLSMFIKS